MNGVCVRACVSVWMLECVSVCMLECVCVCVRESEMKSSEIEFGAGDSRQSDFFAPG